MGLLSPALDEGDWVRLTRRVHVTFTDTLLGDRGGLPPGTRGVVVGRTGNRLDVEFDTGWGTTRARVVARHCRLVRRGGGTARFRQRASTLTWARLGVVIVLAWPVLWYSANYLWTYHTTDGLAGGLAVGFVDGFVAFVLGALGQPVQTALYCVVLVALSRFAFGRRH